MGWYTCLYVQGCEEGGVGREEEEEENSKAMNPKKGELDVNFGALVSKYDNW